MNRDLTLLVMGAALIKSERNKILENVDPGACGEFESIFQGMKEGNWAPMQKFLLDRGVNRTGHPLQQIIEELGERYKQNRCNQLIVELEFSKISSPDELEERLRKALECLTSPT